MTETRIDREERTARGIRFSIAGPVLLAVCIARGRRLPRDLPTFLRASFVGVLLLVIGNGLLNFSETQMSSGLAALLVTTFPIWNTLLGMAGARGERLAPASQRHGHALRRDLRRTQSAPEIPRAHRHTSEQSLDRRRLHVDDNGHVLGPH